MFLMGAVAVVGYDRLRATGRVGTSQLYAQIALERDRKPTHNTFCNQEAWLLSCWLRVNGW